MQFLKVMAAIGLLLGLASMVDAQRVRVEVENLQSNDGFFFTPVWAGFHDGSFDLFNVNSTASAGLELLAEEGDFSVLSGEFAGSGTDGAVFSPGGFVGAPVFDPGEVSAAIFDIQSGERFFSFASMIIPSNDAFFGNGDPTQYELFDINGDFNGPLTIDILGEDIYDAGTEVNDGQGAAFSAVGGTSTDEAGTVALHPGLDNFLGTSTAAGTTIGSIPGAASPIARITVTVVPEPSAAAILLIGSCFGLRRRR